jgi:phosphoglycerate dehydrogenase-like enzyme
MSARVLITAGIYDCPDCRQKLLDAGFEVADLHLPPGASLDECRLADALAGYDTVIAGSEVYSEAVFAACPQLRLVARWGVGFDAVDIAAATAHGVMVTNTPGVITDAVADLAFMLITNLARRGREGDRLVRSGGWRSLVAQNIGGATLGIVGLGAIGACSARRGFGFGMVVLGCDPCERTELVQQWGVRYVDLDTLLGASDFVVLHCNATACNRNMIGARELALMKPNAYLINVARGALVDQDALYTALTTGVIAGAGLDVFAQEPPDPADPLLALDNCLFMPHTATMDRRTIARVSACVTESVLEALGGGRPRCLVNAEVAAG